MSSNWKQPPIDRRHEESPAPTKSGLLSSYTQQQEDLSTLQKKSSTQQFIGPRKPTAPLGGQIVTPKPQPPLKVASSPPSQTGLGGQFKKKTAPLSPLALPAAQSVPKAPPQPVVAPQANGGSRGSALKIKPGGLFINTVRQWSGKMAKMAGYVPQLPAPYMERYQKPSMPVQMPEPKVEAKPWKRSRTLRITRQIKQRRHRWQQGVFAAPRLPRTLTLGFVALMVVLSFSVAGYGFIYYQSELPAVQSLADKTAAQSIRIYDRHNVLLYEHTGDYHKRIEVSYDDVPQVMRDAMIAAEDPTFWSNTGIDPQGILRAAVGLVSHNGAIQSGGSTITQQVVKNLSGQDQDTASRKLQEAVIAMGMTQQYPKAKILEMYFNIAPFDNSDLGIEAAIELYFHLNPQCDNNGKCIPGVAQLNYNTATKKNDPLLGLARATLLASMPQNPTQYDPTKGDDYKQAAMGRQQYVLTQMINNSLSVDGLGPVTPALAQQAEALTAQMTFTPSQNIKLAPHFVDWVLGQVEQAIGEDAFQSGGLNIRTTLDASLEKFVEKAVQRHLTQPEYQSFINDYGPLNTLHNVNDSAVVVINTHTGEILAMDGSADYNSTDPRVGGYYNAAAGGGRPVGSSFKPFEYATSFQMGWYPSMILPDNKTYVPNGGGPGVSIDDSLMYKPPDYGKQEFNGKMDTTIRWATDVSWNIGAVKAAAYVGATNLLTNVQRMGLTHITDTHASWALGTNNASVLEMTGAYQTFSNGGVHIPPQGVLDIWDNYGRNLFHYDPTNPLQIPVFSPEVAYLMTSVLIDQPTRAHEFLNDYVMSFADIDSSCISLSECPHQVAAKTGTTDATVINAAGQAVDVVQDNWTVGYTPDVAVGVWSGNANNAPLDNVIGVTGAAPIWHSAIEAASGYCQPDQYLPCPTDVTPQSLGLDQAQVFTRPPNVSKYYTNMINGLASISGQLTNDDYIIDGLQPVATGIVQPSVANSSGGH